ncbi:MAG: UvrD-helicase domain-containing protein [Mobilitalea sp.]
MAWTDAQQKVIDTRNKNLLVSAAAGSGKTAVLVERIISMISEGDHPIDIDHLLVVTFTNAAAAEMRGRIGKAIDEKLIKQPNNLHLQKQISLLQSAQITTIHSFCLNVIRNYFHRIDLDPSFKIAEESEITLMKSDVISDVLERWYGEEREDFHAFIESYSYSKSDMPIEELILQLYSFSMSDPWPKTWIDNKKKMFDILTMQEMLEAPWMKELLAYVDVVLGDLLKKNSEALAICEESGGPTAYNAALMADRNILEQLRSAGSYEEYAGLFPGIVYDRLSGKKQEGVVPWKKDKVKELRDEVKKGIKDLTSQYFFQSSEEMLKDLQAVGEVMQVLFELTLEFMEEFAKKKEEKNLIDFNDLEHFALKILVKEQVPTVAALELSEQFVEILIDEYQDSNMVQETILRSISKEDIGIPNRFMVGDVKQSIYKFRLAMPEIFMEKYSNYSSKELTEDGQINYYQRIDLDKNFRSRRSVLDYVNNVFEQIMQKPVGGIIYDDAASLKYGELFEETLKQVINETKEKANGEKTEPAIEETDAVIKETELAIEETESRLAREVELLLVTEEVDETNQTDEVIQVGGAILTTSEGEQVRRQTTESNFVPSDEEDLEEAVYTKKEIEARVIARKVKELTDPKNGMLIFDKKLKLHRPATYQDIVILLRTMSNWSEVFVNTLMQEGISAYADTGTGYFQTLEIMTVLNMLRIIDNPRQDIPLVGVLYSPVVGMTTTELALVRAGDRSVSMYSAVLTYSVDGSDEVLKEKLILFTEKLNQFRSMVNHKPIHELIQLILDHTGYYYYASAMPGGDRRKANIDMLISRAVRFEKGSYSGLFHFIRYIEKLHKYEVDFGEAATSGEQDNTVRIMSIHKSKGLEFPIVFVAGMSKQFNTQDLRNSIVLHSELGAGPEYIDSKLRTKVPTLLKKVIQKKVQIENLGEELRVLYVAMTRAKEKLILTGYLKSKDDIKKKEFSFFELLSAKSYLDWVLPAMVNRIGWEPEAEGNRLVWKKEGMSITVLPKIELLKEEVTRQLFLQKDEEELLAEINPEIVYDASLKEEVKTRFDYLYPHLNEAGLKIKMTVSELKKLGQFQDEEQSVNLYQQPRLELATATIPAFIRQEEAEVTGTDRGTLYHKVMELIDLTRVSSKSDLTKELERLVQSNRIKESDVKMLKLDYIFGFVSSNIAERMRKAQANSKLYKEKQFVIGIKAAEVMKDIDSDELILIQGIVDVFFEEDGELVLLDYKSDIVVTEELLVKRYRVQLEYYRKALEQMLNKKVKEMIIFSLPLSKEIRID